MTKLKKSLFLALLTIGVAMASCSDGDDESSKTIELTGGTQTTQTVFADETTLHNGIKFTATEAWTATITEVATTKAAAGRVDWVELSAYSGGAGEFTLTMTLQPNLTGQSRKAEIRIVCGDTTIVIVIEQKGTTQDGTLQKMIRKVIYEYTDNEDEYKSSNEYKSYEFKYNSLGRIAECVRKNGPDASEANLKYTETIAFDYTIANEIRIQNRRIYHDGTSSDGEIEKSTVMLNEQGFATRITFPADYVGFEYNADNRLSKIDNTNTKDDYDKLSEQEKKDFKYIDETGENVFYQTKKTIGDNNFYRNKKEEKERNPSNYIIGGLVVMAVIVKVLLSMDTQGVFKTLGEIFLQPIVFFMVFLPALIWILAWIAHKLIIKTIEADDNRENRKKARKTKLLYNTVMQIAAFLIQIGVALAPLLHH